MNLQIPHARCLSALICFIAIMMVGGAETAPPPTFLGLKETFSLFVPNDSSVSFLKFSLQCKIYTYFDDLEFLVSNFRSL